MDFVINTVCWALAFTVALTINPSLVDLFAQVCMCNFSINVGHNSKEPEMTETIVPIDKGTANVLTRIGTQKL